ncbi:hypothetical protein BS17DRAFT_148261 [Gyrodon lividus]|nr:hypothetical protein BS17DRAFT_148261 [Gyrodon lividus]
MSRSFWNSSGKLPFWATDTYSPPIRTRKTVIKPFRKFECTDSASDGTGSPARNLAFDNAFEKETPEDAVRAGIKTQHIGRGNSRFERKRFGHNELNIRRELLHIELPASWWAKARSTISFITRRLYFNNALCTSTS